MACMILSGRFDPQQPEEYLLQIDALVQVVMKWGLSSTQPPCSDAVTTRLLRDLIMWACEAAPVLDPGTLDRQLRPYQDLGRSFPPVRSAEFVALVCKLPPTAFLELVGSVVTNPSMPEQWSARFEAYSALTKTELVRILSEVGQRLAAIE